MGSPLGDVYVTINEDDDKHPFEVFATLGKAGSIAMADVEAIGRLISLALRFGIPVGEVYQQLVGISSDRVVGLGPNKIQSVPDAIAKAIRQREEEKSGIQGELLPDSVPATAGATIEARAPTVFGQISFTSFDESETFMGTCPECHSQLEMAEGCKKCHGCGFSECG
jgi:ribonucleoside-diphosphate reductase alpha chain